MSDDVRDRLDRLREHRKGSGRLSRQKRIVYCIADAQTKLLELGIEWVFGERETSTPDIDELDRMFRFF